MTNDHGPAARIKRLKEATNGNLGALNWRAVEAEIMGAYADGVNARPAAPAPVKQEEPEPQTVDVEDDTD